MAILYRKRLIPDECIRLDDDIIVHRDENCIITTWKVFRPKNNFNHGISAYMLNEGFKVSYFLKEDNSLCYVYCDIIDVTHDETDDSFVFTDLLADVIIENDGRVRVVDLDELAESCEKKIITNELLIESLYRLNTLLTKIENGEFKEYTGMLDKYIK